MKKRIIKFRVFNQERMWEPFDIREEVSGSLAPTAVVMQFTGLSDKNGQEVYEGDVLKFDDRLGNVVVVWDFDGFTLESRHYSESKENYEKRSLVNATSLEVIGNIYENPELLPPHQEEGNG